METLRLPRPFDFEWIAICAQVVAFFLIFYLDIDSVQFKRGFPPEVGRSMLNALALLLLVPQMVAVLLGARRLSRSPPQALSFAAKFESAGFEYRILA